MKHLIGRSARTVEVPFSGDVVTVRVLSLKELRKFQGLAKSLNDNKDLADDDRMISIQRGLLRASVDGASDLTDDELDDFPPKDLAELVKSVFEANGLDVTSSEVEAGGNDLPTKS